MYPRGVTTKILGLVPEPGSRASSHTAITKPHSQPKEEVSGSSRPQQEVERVVIPTEERHPQAKSRNEQTEECSSDPQVFPPIHIAMKLTILFQNVQGVNDPQKLQIVKNYFRQSLHRTDIICFQEHHLRGDKVTQLGRTIWPEARFMGRKAALGFRH